MAAAVSNAGALGSIGLGSVDAEGGRKAIRAVRAATAKPFNVNVFVHAPPPAPAASAARDAAWCAYLRPQFEKYGAAPPSTLKTVFGTFQTDADMLAMLLEEKPPVVSFHFGLPAPEAIAALKAYGAILFASATSLEEAKVCEAAGVDAIVAQGIEAGGHRGIFDPAAPDDQLPTASLVRLLSKSLSIPIIAAGGIMDGAGIAAALRLGASAAQLGTAFAVTTETAASAGHKAAILGEAGRHTRLVAAVSGRPARSAASNWTRMMDQMAKDGVEIAVYPNAYDLGKQLHAVASAKGDQGWGGFWAGQGAPLAREMGAAELVETLVKEMKEA
ncbi:2-nitropropane dioxygenase [Cutaneotrichosporon oleaginosum]|uniref:2-nitropropane dioxygenase n=1 Tax=Cutaneotrichosporon oleaginosum TaxID=879819 RepID=A0A0J0XS88_9TREE|nr:2-nitropropane dioxygenase [Cutaneotrichosporon oleaginosum]KLT43935.1 2-nitropropane dioxygenase [Cutaneotrichosporon oleaginosum]TXT04118.1 hypothetical protein COLE_07815 [Cutaneotrichosporon oleaginosum]